MNVPLVEFVQDLNFSLAIHTKVHTTLTSDQK